VRSAHPSPSRYHMQRDAEDKIERDFFAAIGRIKRSRPRSAPLQKLASIGRLKMTISNVAIEAGRSRTLIALEDCRYPDVRAVILKNRAPKNSKSPSQVDLVRRLRAEKKTLTERLAAADTMNANLLLRMAAVERSAARAVGRARREIEIDPEAVVGRNSVIRNVVQFRS
jgi:hypothetical protein